MRWCALKDAPSISDPSIVCAYDLASVLEGRNFRASDCIWVPQCRISIFTGWDGTVVDYTSFDDINQSVGEPGDVIFSSTGFEPMDPGIEANNLWAQCEQHWADQPKGILALAIRRFIGIEGNQSAIRGIGWPESDTRAGLIVVDPEFIPAGVNTEHILAHELGHVLGLCHPTGAGCDQGCEDTEETNLNLMLCQAGNDNQTELASDQCLKARSSTVVSNLMSPDCLLDYVIDNLEESEFKTNTKIKALDLYKILVVDEAKLGKDVRIILGTDGILKDIDAIYWITLDIDNNSKTGLNSKKLLPFSEHSGVELVAKITISANGEVKETKLYNIRNNTFHPLNLPTKLVNGRVKHINMSVYSDKGCTLTPAFSEVEITISREGFRQIGLPNENKSVFPNGLRIQAISHGITSDRNNLIDMCPDTVGFLDFPVIKFPEAKLIGNNRPCPGERVEIQCTDLTPSIPIKVTFGKTIIDPDVITSDKGDANFSIKVPKNAPTGANVITIEADDPKDQRRAKIIADVCNRQK